MGRDVLEPSFQLNHLMGGVVADGSGARFLAGAAPTHTEASCCWVSVGKGAGRMSL